MVLHFFKKTDTAASSSPWCGQYAGTFVLFLRWNMCVKLWTNKIQTQKYESDLCVNSVMIMEFCNRISKHARSVQLNNWVSANYCVLTLCVGVSIFVCPYFICLRLIRDWRDIFFRAFLKNIFVLLCAVSWSETIRILHLRSNLRFHTTMNTTRHFSVLFQANCLSQPPG